MEAGLALGRFRAVREMTRAEKADEKASHDGDEPPPD
jgi:hypothetical protein